MVPLQAGLQCMQNGKRGLAAGFFHRHRAKAALQGGILLDIFPVFLPGSGSQHLQLSPAQGGLEDIGSVNGPLGSPRPDDGVHLVHKENHIPAAVNLRQHIPQAFLELSPVFGARHQACHVQADQPLVFQLGRHISHRHALGQALGDGRLPHPGLPHQGRIVLVLPAQDSDYRVDFPVPANYRLHGRGLGNQVLTELLQQFRCDRLLFSPGRGAFPPPQPFQRMGKQPIPADSKDFQKPQSLRSLRPGQSKQKMDRQNLPGAPAAGLPGGAVQQLPCLWGKALGQGQVGGARTA